MNKLNKLNPALGIIKDNSLTSEWSSNQAGITTINNKAVIDFANWDLFNLHGSISKDRELHRFLEEEGLLIKSRRFVGGKHSIQKRLENYFAKFVSKESSLQFTSKKQAYLSLITSIGQSGDLFLFDSTIDAPISDATYIIGAHCESYNALDVQSLEKLIEKNSFYKRFFICVESVSGEDGKVRPLKDYLNLADKYKAELIIDESFAFGVLGLRGAGLLEHLQIIDSKHTIIVDTSFIPNISSCFICSSLIKTNFIQQNSNFLRSDFPVPGFLALAAEKILQKLELDYNSKEKILLSANYLSSELKSLGYKVTQDILLPYVIIKFDNLDLMVEFQKIMKKKSFLVEDYLAIDRFSFYSRILIGIEHSEIQLKKLLEVFSQFCKS